MGPKTMSDYKHDRKADIEARVVPRSSSRAAAEQVADRWVYGLRSEVRFDA